MIAEYGTGSDIYFPGVRIPKLGAAEGSRMCPLSRPSPGADAINPGDTRPDPVDSYSSSIMILAFMLRYQEHISLRGK